MSATSRRGLVIKYEDVAAYLAHEGNEVQAKFFNTFGNELRAACETDFHAQSQMAWVLGDITPENKETLMFYEEVTP